MARDFKYKEARELLLYYQVLLKKLGNVNYFYADLFFEIKDSFSRLKTSGILFDAANEEITTGQRYNEKEINIFLKNLYVYKNGEHNIEKVDSLLKSLDIKSDVKLLNVSADPILWLFSRKKEAAINAYHQLLEFKNNPVVLESQKLLKEIDNISKTSQEKILLDFDAKKDIYKNIVTNICGQSIFDDGTKQLTITNTYKELLKDIKNNSNYVNNNLAHIKESVKAAVENVNTRELYELLKSIPIEEVARKRRNIRTRSLKEAGYNNAYDIFEASTYRLNNVYGISFDTANALKTIAFEYARKAKLNVKIKLNPDDKNPDTTELVLKAYSYKQTQVFIDRLSNCHKHYFAKINPLLTLLESVGGGTNWMFIDKDQQNSIKSATENLKEIFYKGYRNDIQKILLEYQRFEMGSEKEAWEEFEKHPIEIYNIIEKICPGSIESNDSLYGLPEDLANSIKDECIFPNGLTCTLRKYQEWGVKFILHQQKVLLGDEMGLGKTVQAIAAMVSLKNVGASHFIVICPASVLTNWCREITKHSKLRVVKVHGNDKKRNYHYWLKYGGVAVSTFESCSVFSSYNDSFKLDQLIVDEAHYVKNPNASRSKKVRTLSEHTDRVLFMTGTALENKVDEMIELIGILNNDVSKKLKPIAFMASAPRFREEAAAVYYRRKREDVLNELPDLIENDEWCTLSKEERNKYETAILSSNFMAARRLSWNMNNLNDSCKAQRLLEIIEDAKQDNRKVIVFSFFLDTIAKIHSLLKGNTVDIINGSIKPERRQEILDEFEASPAGTTLCAQIQSGGTGLNIQAASVVVICEPQFKPSIENQAISRAYRMGQSRNVQVFRLLCENTIDEKIKNLLDRKQKVFDAFADESVAADKMKEIDDKTFGNIIKEEIERIMASRNGNAEITTPIEIEENEKINNDDLSYKEMMNMKYKELVAYFLNKYGKVTGDYFCNETCRSENSKIKRSSEALFIHHIDEDKKPLLSDKNQATRYPYFYQRADRLVYCNILEHLMLHIKIMEESSFDENSDTKELVGLGGIVQYICPQLNDCYSDIELVSKHAIRVKESIINNFDDYIMMLKRIFELVQNHEYNNFNIGADELCAGFKRNVVSKVYDALLER